MGGPYYKIMSWMISTPMVELPVEIAGIQFPNPVGMPAGWIDTPSKLKTAHDLGVGIPTIKTITVHEKEGNPYPRVIRGEDQMINSLGLPNHGVDWWVENYIAPDYPTIISIKGNSIKEWTELIEKLEPKAPIIELNLSCPNVGNGIMDIVASKTLVEDIASISIRPILLKLSPEFPAKENLSLVEKVRGPIAGITAVNTKPVKNEKLGNPLHTGGLSGIPLYKIMKRQVQVLREKYPTMEELPILATGGIFYPSQAWEVVKELRAIPMGLTGFLMRGPRYFIEIARYIEEKIQKSDDLSSILHLQGHNS